MQTATCDRYQQQPASGVIRLAKSEFGFTVQPVSDLLKPVIRRLCCLLTAGRPFDLPCKSETVIKHILEIGKVIITI